LGRFFEQLGGDGLEAGGGQIWFGFGALRKGIESLGQSRRLCSSSLKCAEKAMKQQSFRQLTLLSGVVLLLAGLAAAQGVGTIGGSSSDGGRSSSGGSSASFRRVLVRSAPKRAKPKPAPASVAKGKKAPPAPKLDADDYFEQGEDLVEAGKLQPALASYRQALNLRPKFPSALYEIGWVYNELGQYEAALAPLREALRYKPDYPEAFNELGYAQRRLGKYSDAAESYRRAVALRPDYALALFGLGDCYYYGTKEYQPALEAYQRGLRLDQKERPQVNYNVGWILNDLERYPEAIGYLETALRQKLERPETAYYELGYAYFKQSKNADAVASYRRAAQVKPDFALAYFGLGDVYYNNVKDYANAAQAYATGLRMNPDNVVAQYRLGWSYNDLGRFNEAVTPLREAIRLKPEYNASYIELGYAYYRLKQYPDALTILRQATQNEPNNSLAYYYMGLNYLDWGRRNEALQVQRALQGIDKNRAQQLLDAINKRR
jgi:tetratricopeptide (TPR) repeat protein